jgi:hypothetical protein
VELQQLPSPKELENVRVNSLMNVVANTRLGIDSKPHITSKEIQRNNSDLYIIMVCNGTAHFHAAAVAAATTTTTVTLKYHRYKSEMCLTDWYQCCMPISAKFFVCNMPCC